MTDRLLQCLYSASASCNNQSETSVAVHDIWKFQTKLVSTEVLALISAPGISTYNGPIANDNGPLLGYISPSASDVSWLIIIRQTYNEK